MDSDGTANLSFQLLNGSILISKNTEINIYENDNFDFVEESNILIGDLYPDQKVNVNFKIKPNCIGSVSIRLLMTADNFQTPEVKKIEIIIRTEKELTDYIGNQELKAHVKEMIRTMKSDLDSYMNVSDFQWMVNHGIKHIENVFVYARKFLQMFPDVLESLSDYELYVLINGIWFHDIGMSHLREEQNSSERRKSHGMLSAKKIKTDSTLSSKIYLEFLKAVGLICIYHQSKSPIDEDHAKLLGDKKIVEYPIKNIMKINFDGEEINIRLRLLAAILSMADAIDIGRHRIEGLNTPELKKDYIDYMNKIYNAKIDKENSEQHFRKHEAIENIVFGKREILLEDAYDGVDDEVREWALEGKKQITDELERCKRVFTENGLTELKVKMD